MKTIGILGGMGPEATSDFFAKLLSFDKASKDQDHVHVIVECDPSIPDRTAFILGKGPDPLPAMLTSARRLEAAGAQIVGIPCMTAHNFLPRLRRVSNLKFISALESMAAAMRGTWPEVRSLGILATAGTKIARLYETYLPGYTIIWPDEEKQKELVMEAIYGERGIKAGDRGEYPRSLLVKAAAFLAAQGADAIVAGCTEVPLALSQEALDLPLVDPMVILAKALIANARED
ncbi:MAG: aspartate racemase [Candidatus Melainabacteria bacterium HGW-Melainabacteria-1]|nr:MAG: aspartate racemase [Candidatus Melainabacteria bacterium HGW-Melainabacteria-1]